MAASVVPKLRGANQGEWIQLLVATQLAGVSAFVLRRHVTSGAVRIMPAAGGRYLYHRGDCQKLREAQIAERKQA